MRQNPAPDREQWLTDLHRQHAGAVYSYARRRVAVAEDAEDVVVEVFATAWRRRDDLPADVLPWLYATASNVIAHVIRGDTRRRRLSARLAVVRPIPDEDPVQQMIEGAAARDAVASAIQELSEADAELLRLWAWEQLEPAQIAQVLGCTAGTARTRLHRARNRMRESLQAPDAPYRAPSTGSEER